MSFYIDGFNLYYGCLRGKPYRWLDIEALCRQYVKPGAELVSIKYFTAKVKDRPDNPGQQEQQRAYLRALKTSTRRYSPGDSAKRSFPWIYATRKGQYGAQRDGRRSQK